MNDGDLVSSGRYQLRERSDGSALLEWRPDDNQAYDRGEQRIPAEVWKLLRAVLEGQKLGPQAVLRLLTGGRSVRRGLD